MLEYEKELLNKNYQFVIATKKWNVVGIMTSDIGFSGGNDYSSVKDVLGDLPIIGKAIEAKDKLGNIFKISGRSNITDFESRLVWNNSKKPQFTVEYRFLNTKVHGSDSPKDALYKAKTLHSAVLPTMGEPAKGLRKGAFFRSPLNYKFFESGAQGVLSLSIGKWFMASDLLVTDCHFTPSKQVMSDGRPLYVTGSITLEPYQAITYAEFLSYFRG